MEDNHTTKEIHAQIMAAYQLLPENVIESDDGFRKDDFLEYISSGNLLMAMEELDGVILDNPSPSKIFWTHLINAAEMMGHNHRYRYESIRGAT